MCQMIFGITEESRCIFCYISTSPLQTHELQTPNEAFFHQNPKLLVLGRQIGQSIWGRCRVFLAELHHPLWQSKKQKHMPSVYQDQKAGPIKCKLSTVVPLPTLSLCSQKT